MLNALDCFYGYVFSWGHCYVFFVGPLQCFLHASMAMLFRGVVEILLDDEIYDDDEKQKKTKNKVPQNKDKTFVLLE
jgi:hypothetical protein